MLLWIKAEVLRMTDVIKLCIASLISFPTTVLSSSVSAAWGSVLSPDRPHGCCHCRAFVLLFPLPECFAHLWAWLPLWPSSGSCPHITFSERMLQSILYKELFLPPLPLSNVSSSTFLQSMKHNRTHCLLVSFLSIAWLLCSHVLFTVVS